MNILDKFDGIVQRNKFKPQNVLNLLVMLLYLKINSRNKYGFRTQKR